MREQLGTISVVVPVYGDGRALDDLAARLRRVLEPIAPWELILVNDGSPPPAWERIRDLASSHTSIKALDLQRNSGQHSALLAGIRASTGVVVITMDDDLQHPPEEIPILLRHLRESGAEVIYGTPLEAVHGHRREFAGSVARQIAALVSGVPEARVVTAFRAFKGTLRAVFARQQGPRVLIDGVLCRAPRKVGAVAVRFEPRRHGRSGYGPRRLIAVAAAMTVGFGIPPSRIAFLMATGGVWIVTGVVLWRRPPRVLTDSPVAAVLQVVPVLTGAAIGFGCLILAAALACALLLAKHSAASRSRGSGYAIRTSINLDLS